MKKKCGTHPEYSGQHLHTTKNTTPHYSKHSKKIVPLSGIDPIKKLCTFITYGHNQIVKETEQ